MDFCDSKAEPTTFSLLETVVSTTCIVFVVLVLIPSSEQGFIQHSLD